MKGDIDLSELSLSYEGYLSRIGRKTKVVKNYYYKLFGNFHFFFLKEDD